MHYCIKLAEPEALMFTFALWGYHNLKTSDPKNSEPHMTIDGKKKSL